MVGSTYTYIRLVFNHPWVLGVKLQLPPNYQHLLKNLQKRPYSNSNNNSLLNSLCFARESRNYSEPNCPFAIWYHCNGGVWFLSKLFHKKRGKKIPQQIINSIWKGSCTNNLQATICFPCLRTLLSQRCYIRSLQVGKLEVYTLYTSGYLSSLLGKYWILRS